MKFASNKITRKLLNEEDKELLNKFKISVKNNDHEFLQTFFSDIYTDKNSGKIMDNFFTQIQDFMFYFHHDESSKIYNPQLTLNNFITISNYLNNHHLLTFTKIFSNTTLNKESEQDIYGFFVFMSSRLTTKSEKEKFFSQQAFSTLIGNAMVENKPELVSRILELFNINADSKVHNQFPLFNSPGYEGRYQGCIYVSTSDKYSLYQILSLLPNKENIIEGLISHNVIQSEGITKQKQTTVAIKQDILKYLQENSSNHSIISIVQIKNHLDENINSFNKMILLEEMKSECNSLNVEQKKSPPKKI